MEVAQGAANDGDVRSSEVGAFFAQGEGERGLLSDQQLALVAGDGDGGRVVVYLKVAPSAGAAVQRIALHGARDSAAGAAHAAFEDGVFIGSEVGRRHVDAVAAVGCGSACEGLAVDNQGHRVACAEFAADFACDRNLAHLALCGADDVVSGHRVDAQGRLGGRGRALEHVVLCGAGAIAAGASDAALDQGVRVGLELSGGHVDAVAAVGSHSAREGLAIDHQGDGIARSKLARDFARDSGGAGVALGGHDDVVARNRIDAQRGLQTGAACGHNALVALAHKGRSAHRAQAQQAPQRREGHHAQGSPGGGDLSAPQRLRDSAGVVAKQRDQARIARVLCEVFVEAAVFCLANDAVVALGHHVVVILNDHIGLGVRLKHQVQVLAHAFGLDVVGGQVAGLALARALAQLHQLVFGARLGLEHQGTCAQACALLGEEFLGVLFFAGVDDDFELLGHGVFFPKFMWRASRGAGVLERSGCAGAKWV